MRAAVPHHPSVPAPVTGRSAPLVRPTRRLGALTGALAIVLSLALSGGAWAHPRSAGALSADTSAAHAVFGSNWPVYHLDGLGDGNDPTGTDLSPAAPAWTSAPVDGPIFGEPLVVGGRVVVATENDTVYELAANTGAVLWSTHVEAPVPSGDLACGDIAPTVGITGTPVIDAARGEVFVVTDESAGGGGAQHYLVGLDLYTGVVLLHQPISLPGSSQLDQLQRPGLALDGGNVIAAFGGNDGDCGTYHGWVVSVPEGGGAQQSFEVATAPGDHEGAVWMGGAAPLVDGQGDIWLATGNSAITSPGQPYDDGDGVLELSPSLHLVQFFAPSTWASDNATDFDLGSSAPALIGNGLAFQAGKSHVGYVLSQADLGGVGHELRDVGSFCTGTVDGGPAVSGATVYEPCQAGLVAVSTSPPDNATILWRTNTGAGGPPVVAGGLVWTIAPGSATLYGLDPGTGDSVESFALGSEANHFPTPTVADGLLLAASATQVHAFVGPAGLPPAPPPPPPRPGYWTVASDGGVFSFGGAPFEGSLGRVHLVKPIVSMAATRDGGGYWLVGSDGGIFAFGDAAFAGSMGGRPLAKPVVGMAAGPQGAGYWEVASDGGIFSFGRAPFSGSMGGRALAKPIVGMAATPDGGGYWLVGSDGGIFAFGGARFFGSMGGRALAKPIVGMAATPDGGGYWLVASDGGIFAFGDARFLGSTGGLRLARPVVSMADTGDGGGYWLVGSDGGIFAFGDASFEGSVATARLSAPMTGIAGAPLP